MNREYMKLSVLTKFIIIFYTLNDTFKYNSSEKLIHHIVPIVYVKVNQFDTNNIIKHT